MALRTQWKGMMRVGLLNIPSRLYGVEEKSSAVSFNRLCACCKGQTQNKVWCPTCKPDVSEEVKNELLAAGKDVTPGKELIGAEAVVKGYEFAKGLFVTVTKADLDPLATDEAENVLDITTVTDEPVNPIYVDDTSYLVPEVVAQEAFETIRQALGDRLAIGTIVIRDRAIRVALEPQAEGFIVYKLRAAEAVRTLDQIDMPRQRVVPSPQNLALGRQLLDALTGTFAYEGVRNEYQDRLKAMLTAKVNGTEQPAAPVTTAPRATANLTEALAQSLAVAKAKVAVEATPDKTKLPEKATKPAKASVPIQGKKRKRA